MRKWLKHLKNQKGLTLIELLAVVVILGIIAAIAVPAVGNIIDNSKKDAHVANALLIINAAKLGVVSKDINKSEITGSEVITLSELVGKKLLDAIPSDPDSDAAYQNGQINMDANGKYTIYLEGVNHKLGASAASKISEAELNSLGRSAVINK
ncbi:MAG: type II secretion system protein [Paenisporosarcina sp.]